MTDYNNDDLDDYEEVEETPVDEQGNGNGNGNGRNFWLALGILGGIFVLLVVALIIVFLSRQRGTDVTNIDATNAVIMTANAATANAATETAAFLLTPSATPTFTQTLPATATSVLAIATATPTVDDKDAFATQTAEAAGTAGPVLERNTATVAALLTQQAPTSVAQTQVAGGRATNTPQGLQLTIAANTAIVQTQAAGGIATNTPGALPTAGFADEVGLPGLFGMALGLVLLIVLVRRLRLTTNP